MSRGIIKWHKKKGVGEKIDARFIYFIFGIFGDVFRFVVCRRRRRHRRQQWLMIVIRVRVDDDQLVISFRVAHGHLLTAAVRGVVKFGALHWKKKRTKFENEKLFEKLHVAVFENIITRKPDHIQSTISF